MRVGRLGTGIPSMSSTGTPQIISSVCFVQPFISLLIFFIFFFEPALCQAFRFLQIAYCGKKIGILAEHMLFVIVYRWGSAYLTRDFFHNMASKMGDNVLLVAAEEGEELVAAALNLIGGDTLYGRLWGCHPGVYYPNLHFEACYYQVLNLLSAFICKVISLVGSIR